MQKEKNEDIITKTQTKSKDTDNKKENKTAINTHL